MKSKPSFYSCARFSQDEFLIYFSEAVFLQENTVLKNKQNYMYIGLQFIACTGFVFFCFPLIYLGDLWWEAFEEKFYIEE